MRHHNSVLHDLLKQIPWPVFERLVDEHGSDRRIRRLSTKSQLVALLYGQLAGASSLREIEAGLASHAVRLYHVGGHPVSRSTLADANSKRPAAVFGELFGHLAGRASRRLRRKTAEAVRLIDSTGLPLSAAAWAHFSAKACGAKAHVIYDPDAGCPLYCAITPARRNDITVAQAMPIEAGATYVFDLGYYDYAWWARLDAQGCRIVTRFKSNTPLTLVERRRIPPGEPRILSDRIGQLPPRQASRRQNPFHKPVREVRVRIETGKILRILSNDLKATAHEIADLYKRRWQIELFFRWVKQTLKIRHFLGTSENAVRIQIAVALIAFLLIRLAHAAVRFHGSPLTFIRLARVNLMHRRSIAALATSPPPPVNHPRQFSLTFATI